MDLFLPLFLLFTGIFFAGDIIAIPSLFIAAVSTESFYLILTIAIGATLSADTLWYVLGKYLKKEDLYALPFLIKREKVRNAVDALFKKHGLKTVFLSRFVYGVRLITQALAGMHKIPFYKYIAVDALGVIVWFSGIALVISLIRLTLGEFHETILGIQIAAALILVILVGINVLGKKLLQLKNGKFFQSSEKR